MITALLFPLWLGGVARADDNPPPPHGGRPPPQQQDHPHPKKKEPHWESEPFLRPEGGAQLNTSGGTPTAFVTLGAQAGFRYWRVGDPPPRWQGQTRVRGAYGTGSGVQSIDARIGSFIGPTWGAFGVQFGPDLFWNELLNPGPADLDPSVGVEFPVIASYAVSKSLHIYGGISPAWLANPERSVDWSEVALPGFGGEFAYLAGVSVSFGSVHVGLNYSYRIVATGGQQNIGLGFNLSG